MSLSSFSLAHSVRKCLTSSLPCPHRQQTARETGETEEQEMEEEEEEGQAVEETVEATAEGTVEATVEAATTGEQADDATARLAAPAVGRAVLVLALELALTL